MSWNNPALVIARLNFFNTTSNRSVSLKVTSMWSFQNESSTQKRPEDRRR